MAIVTQQPSYTLDIEGLRTLAHDYLDWLGQLAVADSEQEAFILGYLEANRAVISFMNGEQLAFIHKRLTAHKQLAAYARVADEHFKPILFNSVMKAFFSIREERP